MEFQRNRFARALLDDREIVELYWKRDERAIEETDLKYKKYLLAIAYNIVHDSLDCEECLNDTYMSAWNAIPPSKPTALRAFLTTIIRRIAVNRYHSNRKKGNIPSEMTVALSDIQMCIGDEVSVEEEVDTSRLGKIISDYLRTLTQRRRFIFMSRFYMAQTVDKIASDLKVSRSTVNKELAFIRDGLKAVLEREGFSV